MNNFRRFHPESPRYHSIFSIAGWQSYDNLTGWTDHLLGDSLVYSHRQSDYTPANFLDQLHTHDYYELLILVKGDMAFPAEDQYIPLRSGAIMLYPPGCIHGCKLLSNSVYERYVFYFQKDAFQPLNNTPSLLDFYDQPNRFCLFLPVEFENAMFSLLSNLDRCMESQSPDGLILAYSYIIQLFYLINQHATATEPETHMLPEVIVKVKQYVDENFLNLNNITEIADAFFYSREHVSRLFKECYNTNLSDYINTLKIRHSKQLLEAGSSVTDACYQSGFRNMSTFTTIFRKQVYMTPSQYRKEFQFPHKLS